MVKAILQEAIYRPAFLCLQQTKTWTIESQVSTEKALQHIKSDLALSHNYKVSLLNATELSISSDVTCLCESLFTYNATLAQGSENDSTLYVCTCKVMWDTGRLCKHAIVVFVRLRSAPNVGNWNSLDTKWVILKEAYLVSSYFNQYNLHILSLSTPHVPDPDVRLKPWDIVSKQGRPKKRRMTSDEGSHRACQACGRMGHYSNTCDEANTQQLLATASTRRQPLSVGVDMSDRTYCCDSE